MHPLTFWVGVDIGGTKTAVVISHELPEVISRVEFATAPARGPEPALNEIFNGIEQLLAEHDLGPRQLAGIGVSCGDPLDRATGMIQEPPNLPGWVNVPIKSLLEEKFGVPCRLENDANAGAVAEHRFGAGLGARNMVFLTVGTGLGGGLILENRLYHGSTDSAGEIGHVRLTPRGPLGYGKAGSVEGWASGGGMAQVATRMAAAAQKRGRSSRLLPERQNHTITDYSITARDVAAAALQGDPLALEILRVSGRKLGEAMAIIVDLINPECIVAGGIAMRLGDLLLGPARRILNQEALARPAGACRVVPAALGERIGDVAALCVAKGLCET
jgi:glucokinase